MIIETVLVNSVGKIIWVPAVGLVAHGDVILCEVEMSKIPVLLAILNGIGSVLGALAELAVLSPMYYKGRENLPCEV